MSIEARKENPVQMTQEELENLDRGAFRYTCNVCAHVWEVVYTLGFHLCKMQHGNYVGLPKDHPYHTNPPDDTDVDPRAVHVKRHDEFICKNCGEMRDLSEEHVK